eukprot:jgi/Mesen1/10380/ME000081S09768
MASHSASVGFKALALDCIDIGAAGGILHKAFSISSVSVALAAAATTRVRVATDVFFHDRASEQFGPSSFWFRTAACEEVAVPYVKPGYQREDILHLKELNNIGTKVKVYYIKIKPIFSIFTPKVILISAIRALLLNYLPVLEAYLQPDEEYDEDYELDSSRAPDFVRPAPDLIRPAWGTLKTMVREISVMTMRRLLEKYLLKYLPARWVWKLTKDTLESTQRKSRRGIGAVLLFVTVARSQFRGHIIQCLAGWLIQLKIDIFRCVRSYRRRKERTPRAQKLLQGELVRLGKRVTGHTVKTVGALACGSLCSALGALIWVKQGPWIGFVIGDAAGPFLVGYFIDGWMYSTKHI